MMKIILPVEEDRETVCPSFGRTSLFLVYDTETKEKDYLENDAADSPGGAGIKAAQIIIDAGAEAMLAPRCGENAAKVLEAAQVTLYQTKRSSATENIAAFEAGALSKQTEIHPGFHGHGG